MSKPRVVALQVEGTDTDLVGADLAAVVPPKLRILEADAFAEALAKNGQRGPFGAVLGQPRQRGRALARLRKAATAAGADAVLVARARHEGGAVKVRILFVDPAADEPVVDEDLVLAGDEHARRDAIAAKLRAPLEKLIPTDTAPVAAPPPPPKPEPPPKPPRLANEVGTAIIVAGAGFDLGGRWFRYTDGASLNLRPYSGFPVPGAAVSVEVYPFAALRVPVAGDLGVTVAYAHLFPSKSSASDTGAASASWDRLRAGLRYRLRLDDLPGQDRPDKVPDSPILGFSGGVGFERFGLDATGQAAREVADVSYVYLHGGIDGRFPVSQVAVLLHGAWLGALSAGAVYDRFRDAHIGGLDVGGGLAIKIAAGFEARLTADYTRYFYSFAPKFGDAYIAGGAVDELLVLHLGGAYAY